MSKKRNLDMFLAEVFKQFIAIRDEDFKTANEVFKIVFNQVMQKMKEKCNYFQRYSSQVLHAGSVYDGIKVSKMDEFDMDIVIRLPVSYEPGPDGIGLENDRPGYVRLKITNPFDNLDKQPDWEKCHKVTREWRDADKYLLQNKFRQWLHAIVQRALNDLNGKVDVNGTEYLVTYKTCGPAFSLNITYEVGGEKRALDVDLVPVIRFRHPRWPEGYRSVEGSQAKDWLVVPKPNKIYDDGAQKNRCWRLSFQEFEREMMKGCQALKTTIRLVKKLRDSLELKHIASYYIKTLFLWEIDRAKDESYWRNKLSVTFRGMVEKLYLAIKNRNIPYFWHEKNNLIEGLKPTLCKVYEEKLKKVLLAIDANDVEKVITFILSSDELRQFKESDFYRNLSGPTSRVTEQTSIEDGVSLVKTLNAELDSLRSSQSSQRDDGFEKRFSDIEDRVTKLEMEIRIIKAALNNHL